MQAPFVPLPILVISYANLGVDRGGGAPFVRLMTFLWMDNLDNQPAIFITSALLLIQILIFLQAR